MSLRPKQNRYQQDTVVIYIDIQKEAISYLI